MRFYRPFIPPNALCFDIGAHLGNRADAWLSLGARVIAVEPQPQCIQYLQKRFGNRPSMTIVPKAIGSIQGTARMYVSSLDPTVSTLASEEWRTVVNEMAGTRKVKWDQHIEVEIVTLDDLISEYGLPDFCKIDVEDYELEVLKGLTKAVPMLSFEFFDTTIPRALDCVKAIDQLGDYRYNYSIGESQKWALDGWVSETKMTNLLQNMDTKNRSGDIYARLASFF